MENRETKMSDDRSMEGGAEEADFTYLGISLEEGGLV